jgi:hypothetical protein
MERGYATRDFAFHDLAARRLPDVEARQVHSQDAARTAHHSACRGTHRSSEHTRDETGRVARALRYSLVLGSGQRRRTDHVPEQLDLHIEPEDRLIVVDSRCGGASSR